MQNWEDFKRSPAYEHWKAAKSDDSFSLNGSYREYHSRRYSSFFMTIGGVQEFVPFMTYSDRYFYLTRRFLATKDRKYLDALSELRLPIFVTPQMRSNCT